MTRTLRAALAIAIMSAAPNTVAAASQSIELRAYVPVICEAQVTSAALDGGTLSATYTVSARCNTHHVIEVSLAGTPTARATVSYGNALRIIRGNGTAAFAGDRFVNGQRQISVTYRGVSAAEAANYLRATRLSFRAV